MQIAKLSEDYKLEIPERVRERIELSPGQEFKVHLHGDHILLVPVRPLNKSKTYGLVAPRAAAVV